MFVFIASSAFYADDSSIYRVGQKVRSGFSARSNGKTRTFGQPNKTILIGKFKTKLNFPLLFTSSGKDITIPLAAPARQMGITLDCFLTLHTVSLIKSIRCSGIGSHSFSTVSVTAAIVSWFVFLSLVSSLILLLYCYQYRRRISSILIFLKC